jgi:hypothetical protein
LKKALIFLPGLCRFYDRNGFFLNFFQDDFFRKPLCQQPHFVPKWLVAVLPLPGYSFSDGHSVFKVQLIDELP